MVAKMTGRWQNQSKQGLPGPQENLIVSAMSPAIKAALHSVLALPTPLIEAGDQEKQPPLAP